MSDDKSGLWDKLIQRKNETAAVNDESVGTEERLKSFLEKEKSRDASNEIKLRKDRPDAGENARRPVPVLHGKLAEYLSSQPQRQQFETIDLSGKRLESWTIDDPQKRAAIALSLILTSHLARFAGTGIGEHDLNEARDEALKDLEGRDTVRLEVEAYELLNWFAAAMNPEWQESHLKSTEIVKESASEDVLTHILERAINEKIDLRMRYYTGSRGEFSERVISPIAMSAEKYLIAYCHSRQQERVFRLSRILKLMPVVESQDTANMYFPVYKEELPELQPPLQLPKQTSETVKRAKDDIKATDKQKSDRKSSKFQRRPKEKSAALPSDSTVYVNADDKPENPKRPKASRRKATDSNQTKAQKPLFAGKANERPKRVQPPKATQQFLPGFSDTSQNRPELSNDAQEKPNIPDNAPRLPGI